MDERWSLLLQQGGFTYLPDLVRLGVRGSDRTTFLHNFTTADFQRMQPGQTTEAFVLNAKGHVIAHLLAECRVDEWTLFAWGNDEQTLHDHFDRYIIREDVELVRYDDASHLLLLAPPDSKLGGRLPQPGVTASIELATRSLPAIGIGCTAPLSGAILDLDPLNDDERQAVTEAAGVPCCDRDLVEMLRIEASLPKASVDFTSDALPQEFGRDADAISFTKGCYLGQETVARIDAMGHVNRGFKQLVFANDLPTNIPPIELPSPVLRNSDGKELGSLTSLAYSHRLGQWIGFALLHRQSWEQEGDLSVGPHQIVILDR